jgi:hypothetical protein
VSSVFNLLTLFYKGKPLGRPRPRWEVDIRMDRSEIGWENVDCVNVAQDRERLTQYSVKATGWTTGVRFPGDK